MSASLAFFAALGCAVFNGVAAVLQKVSADRATRIGSLADAEVMAGLLERWPYLLGIILDLAAGVLTLFAVHILPLFLVQSLVASSIVVTALIERFFLGHKLGRRTYVAILMVVLGIICLSLAAHPEGPAAQSFLLHAGLLAGPVVLLILGGYGLRSKARVGWVVMTAASGAAFGAISIIGRVFVYPINWWQIFANPLTWALLAYAVVGMLFFTAALQRTWATNVNGISVGFQMIIPLLVGLILLGDTARAGLWPLVVIGTILVLIGCADIAWKRTVHRAKMTAPVGVE